MSPRLARSVPLSRDVKALAQQQGGQTSEALFERTHQRYAELGRATVVKQHAPTVGPPTALRYSGGAFVDYVGALSPRGLMLAFDLKGCTGATKLEPAALPKPDTPVKVAQRALKDRERLKRQAQLLVDLRRMGAMVAFFCVDLRRERVWIIEDVARVARLEPVSFRERDRDLVPSVAFSSLEAIAHGEPTVDYLSIWPTW
jgi:hypothetical protein